MTAAPLPQPPTQAQTCGGLDAFDLYQLSAGPSMCTGAPLEAYSQVRGFEPTNVVPLSYSYL